MDMDIIAFANDSIQEVMIQKRIVASINRQTVRNKRKRNRQQRIGFVIHKRLTKLRKMFGDKEVRRRKINKIFDAQACTHANSDVFGDCGSFVFLAVVINQCSIPFKTKILYADSQGRPFTLQRLV